MTQPSSGHTNLTQIVHFFSSDQLLVLLTPPKTLNVEICELVKWETYWGLLAYCFLMHHVKGLPQKKSLLNSLV